MKLLKKLLPIMAISAFIFLFACYNSMNNNTQIGVPMTRPISDPISASATHDTELETKYPGITFLRKDIDGIPVIDIFNNDDTKKPTIFVIHSYMTSKYQYLDLAVKFAHKGYYAVILDAYGHGERPSEEIKSFPEVVSMYPNDIITVVDSMKQNPQADLDKLAMTGISMGACTIYQYSAIAPIKPKVIAPMIGTPYFEQLMNTDLSRTTYDVNKGQGVSSLEQERLNEILMNNSPYKNYDKLKDIAILMQQGKHDDLITSQGAEMLYNSLKGIGAKNVELIIHPHLGHNMDEACFQKTIDFIDQHINS